MIARIRFEKDRPEILQKQGRQEDTSALGGKVKFQAWLPLPLQPMLLAFEEIPNHSRAPLTK